MLLLFELIVQAQGAAGGRGKEVAADRIPKQQ